MNNPINTNRPKFPVQAIINGTNIFQLKLAPVFWYKRSKVVAMPYFRAIYFKFITCPVQPCGTIIRVCRQIFSSSSPSPWKQMVRRFLTKCKFSIPLFCLNLRFSQFREVTGLVILSFINT